MTLDNQKYHLDTSVLSSNLSYMFMLHASSLVAQNTYTHVGLFVSEHHLRVSPTSLLCKKCKCSSTASAIEMGNMGKSMAELALFAKLNHLDTRTRGPEHMGTHYTNVTETPILVGCDRVLQGVPKALNDKPTTPNSCILGPWLGLWSTKMVRLR